MSRPVRIHTTILPGGRIEISDPQFVAGEAVDILVLTPQVPIRQRVSVLEILSSAPGHRVFQTAEEVDEHIKQERASWD